MVGEWQDGVSDCTCFELQALLRRLRPDDITIVPHLRSPGSSLEEVVQHVQSHIFCRVGGCSLCDFFAPLRFFQARMLASMLPAAHPIHRLKGGVAMTCKAPPC